MLRRIDLLKDFLGELREESPLFVYLPFFFG